MTAWYIDIDAFPADRNELFPVQFGGWYWIRRGNLWKSNKQLFSWCLFKARILRCRSWWNLRFCQISTCLQFGSDTSSTFGSMWPKSVVTTEVSSFKMMRRPNLSLLLGNVAGSPSVLDSDSNLSNFLLLVSVSLFQFEWKVGRIKSGKEYLNNCVKS